MYYIYGRVRAIPTYRVYRLYVIAAPDYCVCIEVTLLRESCLLTVK